MMRQEYKDAIYEAFYPEHDIPQQHVLRFTAHGDVHRQWHESVLASYGEVQHHAGEQHLCELLHTLIRTIPVQPALHAGWQFHHGEEEPLHSDQAGCRHT